MYVFVCNWTKNLYYWDILMIALENVLEKKKRIYASYKGLEK